MHAEILAGLGEIDAFLVAEKASTAALKATVAGYGEGVYLATDVLDAEEELFSVNRNCAKRVITILETGLPCARFQVKRMMILWRCWTDFFVEH